MYIYIYILYRVYFGQCQTDTLRSFTKRIPATKGKDVEATNNNHKVAPETLHHPGPDTTSRVARDRFETVVIQKDPRNKGEIVPRCN